VSQHTRRRNTVWAVTWLAYAAYYLGRKGFSAAKAGIESDGLMSLRQLGYVDSGYLAAYSVGQFLSGALGAFVVGLAVPPMVRLWGWDVPFPSLAGVALRRRCLPRAGAASRLARARR
jgi:hypothetical protein